MRSLTAVAAATLLLAGAVRAEDKKPAAPPAAVAPSAPPAMTQAEVDRALYATGLSISKSLEPFNLSPNELTKVVDGIRDGIGGKGKFELDEAANRSVQSLVQARLAVTAGKEKSKGEEYLKKAATEKGAVKTASGLIITHVKEGAGASPAPTDKVKVHYTGTLTDGKGFDSSVKRGQPIDFTLNQVVPCWTEALGLMKAGGKAKIVCPPEIAYGAQGRPPTIPGNAVLLFDVELISVEAAAKPPEPAK